jgi:hypothetical protein
MPDETAVLRIVHAGSKKEEVRIRK